MNSNNDMEIRNTCTNNVSVGDGKGKTIKLRLLNESYLPYIRSKLGSFTLKVEEHGGGVQDIDEWTGMPEWKVNDDKWYLINLTLQGKKERDWVESWDWSENPKGCIKLTDKTNKLWYPYAPDVYSTTDCWITPKKVIPKYPIYVISKGRSNTRLTSDALVEMGVEHYLVIEEQETDQYIKDGCNRELLLILPKELCNLGQGGIPVRNFVWDHSVANGDKRHWILDDNMDGFYRFHDNRRTKVNSGVCFRVIEDYVDRFKNVYQSGMQYYSRLPNISKARKMIQHNTKVYSCILMQNDCPFRWRGRYNEDVDLSLRILKAGYPTMLFNMFLCYKAQTMSIVGGNTDGIYSVKDAFQLKLDSLIAQHPDVVKPTVLAGHAHHNVNWKPFEKNKAILIDGYERTNEGTNEYGMVYVPDYYEKVDTYEKSRITKAKRKAERIESKAAKSKAKAAKPKIVQTTCDDWMRLTTPFPFEDDR